MDMRLTPARLDLAAMSLKGVYAAPLYVQAEALQVVKPTLPLRRAAEKTLPYETELLFGEMFDVYALENGFAWGQAKRDGYVGYVEAQGLEAAIRPPTHRVCALRSFVYPSASIKTSPILALPYNALVNVQAWEGDYAKTPEGYLHAAHLAALGDRARDPVAEAERFIGIPYLWGGKSSLGLDCSGLVENACFACGLPALRDSDMQETSLGLEKTTPERGQDYQRGDLLFWPGHVAIAQGNGQMIHANAHHMMVVSEPIDAAITRIAARGIALRSVRHLPIPA